MAEKTLQEEMRESFPNEYLKTEWTGLITDPEFELCGCNGCPVAGRIAVDGVVACDHRALGGAGGPCDHSARGGPRLRRQAIRRPDRLHARPGHTEPAEAHRPDRNDRGAGFPDRVVGPDSGSVVHFRMGEAGAGQFRQLAQIGRASCRERV